MGVRAYINKRFTNSRPGKTIINTSKKIYLPGFSGFSVYELWNPFF